MSRRAALCLVAVVAVGPARAAVVINEIHYNPGSPGGSEFVEVHNAGAADLDLGGWRLSGAVEFAFPPGTELPPDAMLVVAEDPAGLAGVAALGPWDGHLSDRAEEVVLLDSAGWEADRVRYADDGPWPSGPDGDGPSLELICPHLPNEFPEAWAAGPIGGTPGAPNASFSEAPMPFASGVLHTPLVPVSGEAISISARLHGVLGGERATLWWRRDGDPVFQSAPMQASGERVVATLPAQPGSTVVEYYLEVADSRPASRLQPASAPMVNWLCRVEASLPATTLPLYHLIMTAANWEALRTRDPFSNDLLPASVIASGEAYHCVGLRYRGSNTRVEAPLPSFRVNFQDAQPLAGTILRLNLNSFNPERQWLGMDLFARVGILAPEVALVSIVTDEGFFTPYAQVEEVDEDFLDRRLGTHQTSLYKAEETADLAFRGDDPAAYAVDYAAETEASTYLDLAALCQAFATEGDEAFAQAMETWIDVEEWLTFFAVNAVLSNQEGSIYRDTGDDYFLLRHPATGRFLILPWDMDSTFLAPRETIFRPTVPAIVRLLHHPTFARRYEEIVQSLLAGAFSTDTIAARVALLPPEVRQDLKLRHVGFTVARRRAIESQLPSALRAGGLAPQPNSVWALEEEQSRRLVITPGSPWRFLRGSEAPATGWREPGFDDTGWDEAVLPLGVGAPSVATVLTEMASLYTTVSLRSSFEIADPARISQLTLTIDYDDGFIAWLNGVEVARGNVSGDPGPSGTADGPHPAGAPELRRLNGFIPHLRAGTNILAITVFNSALDDPDVVIDATLGITERPLFGLIQTPEAKVTLGGVAPLPQTWSVLVGDQTVSVDPVTGAWQASLDSSPGLNAVEAIARDLAGAPLVRATLRWVYAPETFDFSGRLPPGQVIGLLPTERLIRVRGNAELPPDSALQLGPGAVIALDPGATLLAYGPVEALGTAEQPVIMMPAVPGAPWGSIAFAPGSPGGRFAHTEFLLGGRGQIASWQLAATVDSLQSAVDLLQCAFRFGTDKALVLNQSSGLVRGCYFHNIPEAITAQRAALVVQDSVFTDAALAEPKDPVDINNLQGPSVAVRNNLFLNGADDAVDIDVLSGVVSGNTVIGFSDKGLSVAGGAPRIDHNVVADCTTGIALKDGTSADLNHNTLWNCGTGVDAHQSVPGAGGGQGRLESSLVWNWRTGSVVFDALSYVTVNRCDVMGGAPVPGNGNMDVEPQLVAPAARNFHPRATSPLIGAGLEGSTVGALDAETARFDGFATF